MTLRRIRFSVVVVLLSVFFLAAGATRPAANYAAPKAAPANWTFSGCWTQFPAGPCRDIFRDDQGNYWICRACGTTGNPNHGKCNPISSQTLASGYWCS